MTNRTVELSKLPRTELAKMLMMQAFVSGTDVSVLTAATYRIIDLEYELERVRDKLAHFEKEFEAQQYPAADVFEGEYCEVRG